MVITNTLPFLLSQLLAQGPMLLVCIGGLIACAAFWRRASFAAMLAIIGLALMLFTTLGGAVVSNYLFMTRGSSSAASIAATMSIVSFLFAIVRAVGLALLVWGVFAQRPMDERGFEVTDFNRPQA